MKKWKIQEGMDKIYVVASEEDANYDQLKVQCTFSDEKEPIEKEFVGGEN